MDVVSYCKVCSGELLHFELNLYEFPTITSDSRPWPPGRSVATCKACGLTQRILLPEAISSFENVYANYDMFSHAKLASDQQNFDNNGVFEGRTKKILKFIQNKLVKSPHSVLDIGSGSGAGLIALAEQFPFASVDGYEPNGGPAERQTALPANVSILNQLPEAEKKYDLITLFHVLEHVDDIFKLFKFITSALTPAGQVLIQVPYHVCNPFDFIIADHLWHFSKKSIVSLLEKTNFTVNYIGNELLEKELTILAIPATPAKSLIIANETGQEIETIAWLLKYKLYLDSLKKDNLRLAVYGTGPAGAWTGAILGDTVVAYVEDDPARVHSTFNTKPVLSPLEIDKSVPIVAAFPDKQARRIAKNNKDLNILLSSEGLKKS